MTDITPGIIYSQSKGKFILPTEFIVFPAYAGGGKFPDYEPSAKNNPNAQTVSKYGPLPRGFYTIGDPVNDSRLGEFAIPLIATPGTPTFGRFGFYIHGDSIDHPGKASEGCIVTSRDCRETIAKLTKKVLQVVE